MSVNKGADQARMRAEIGPAIQRLTDRGMDFATIAESMNVYEDVVAHIHMTWRVDTACGCDNPSEHMQPKPRVKVPSK